MLEKNLSVRIPCIKYLIAFTIFCIGSNFSYCQEDSIEQLHFDSIQKFEQQDSFIQYFNQLIILKDHYKNYFNQWENKTEAKKRRAKKMLNLLDKFKVYREPLTDEEKLKVRWYYGTSFYWKRNHTGNFTEALKTGIKATNYVVDPVLLDRQAHFIEMEIGSIYARIGDFDRALLYYKKVIPWYKHKNEKEKLSKLYANIGNAYKWLKDFESSKAYLLQGIKLANEVNCTDCFLANHTRLRDLAYDEKDYKTFLEYAEIDSKLLINSPPTSKTSARILELDEAMGTYYFDQKDYTKALALYQKVKEVKLANSSSKLNREIAKVTSSIAKCYFKFGDNEKFLKESQYALNSILPNFSEIIPPDSLLYSENTFLDIFDPMHEFYVQKYITTQKKEYLDSSIMLLDKSIQVSNLLSQKIIYSDSKSNFTKESKSYVDKAVELSYLRQNNTDKHNYDYTSIRNLFNSSKDQILKSKIELQDKIKTLNPKNQQIVDSLIQVIVIELGSAGKSDKRILECQDNIEALTGFNIKSQGQIPLKGDYIEYLNTHDNVFILSRIDSVMMFTKLGSKLKLDSLINTFNQLIKSKKETDLILERLSSFLIPENLELSTSFTIIPDERITVLPIDLLRRNKRYLLEDHTISIQTHYYQKPNVTQNKIQLIYCVIPKYSLKTTQPSGDVDRSGFYPLPFAKEEVRSIKSLFSSSFIAEDNSSPTSIANNLEKANIFHFTGHAKANQDSAYLVLNSKDSIIKWTFEQIYHNNFDLSLVTLSACETGLGVVQYGDGLNSMARSFLGAGAEAVVYSLWTVNDMSTATIMKSFYQELKQGASKSEALRQAKLKYLNTAIPERRHPYYWGGFVAAGNMAPLQLSSSNSTNYYLLIALLIVILGALLYKTIKTKHL